MKVYLAGKVSNNDWRHGIVGWELRNADGNGNWRDFRIPFGNGLIYTGPFFVACDHGCSHVRGEHGVVPEMCQPAYQRDHCAPNYDEEGRRPWDITVSDGAPENYNPQRKRLHLNCTQAIDDSDLVFAWLDDPSAFGSIWELGYAAGRDIHTAVGMPVDFD